MKSVGLQDEIHYMDQLIGRISTVEGSHITIGLDGDGGSDSTRVGSLVKVLNGERGVVAGISAVKLGGPTSSHHLGADLLGELVSVDGESKFIRGVSAHPLPSQPVYLASDADLCVIYGEPTRSNVRVGTLYNDPDRPAFVITDELLGKHFAILGTTGAGKSCALTVILRAILARHLGAHVVLLDPHNEYGRAFGELAHVINVDNLQLPFWLLNFEEAARVLIRGGSESEQDSQAFILNDAMTWARRNYRGTARVAPTITVDTPVPFRIHELLRYINDEMGRVTKPDTSKPYQRLLTRIESLRQDRRFEFLFSSEDDILPDIIGRLLRVPVNRMPLTIVDLSGVPSEIADVIVSTLCRILFDVSVWAGREQLPPLLLVCEEAHRYVPADERLGFAQTVKVITQIAKEGRKYGISLALITQRPSELSVSALSQCGTVFALRLGSESDQQLIARTIPNVARGMLSALPSLPTRQAIVAGEAARIPMRIRFDDLPDHSRPHSESAEFSRVWQTDAYDRASIDKAVLRWRAQVRR
jgi:uncharacterized protein